MVDYRPNAIAGSPGADIPVHDAFITHHIPLMVEKYYYKRKR
jgi:hypothetical protein